MRRPQHLRRRIGGARFTGRRPVCTGAACADRVYGYNILCAVVRVRVQQRREGRKKLKIFSKSVFLIDTAPFMC